jgi:hypothetical protein
MVLFHDIIEILHLANTDCRPVFCVVTANSRSVGLTPINGNLLGHVMPADRLGEKAFGRLLVALLGQEEIDGLAVFIDGTIQVAPLPFHPDVRFVHAPADPHGALRAVKCFLQLRTVFDDPPVNGGVIHVDTPIEHKFFDVARAQRVGDISADARESDVLRHPHASYGTRVTYSQLCNPM